MRSWGTHCRTRRIAWERTGQGFVQSQRAKKTVAQCCPIRWHLSGAIKYREVHKELVILEGKTKLPRFNSDPMNNNTIYVGHGTVLSIVRTSCCSIAERVIHLSVNIPGTCSLHARPRLGSH